MRGQTELIGIMFIVLLLSLGFIFLITPASEIQLQQAKTQTIEVLLNTDIVCNGQAMKISDSVRNCERECRCVEEGLRAYLDRFYSGYIFEIEKNKKVVLSLRKDTCRVNEKVIVPDKEKIMVRFGRC